jgi:phosphatidyl-myo-inositol dimannoside synthase
MQKHLKLLLITNAYAPPLEGGHIVFLHNLVSHCPESNIIVYSNARSGQTLFDSQEGYRIIRSYFQYNKMSKLEQLGMTLERLITLVPLLRREPVDIFLAGTLFNEGMICWVLERLFHKPYILFGYGEELNNLLHRSDRFWRAIKRSIYCRLIKDAAGLISISDYTSSLFMAFGADASKICKIVPTVSPAQHADPQTIEAIKCKYKLLDDQRIILSVSRLTERKGQHELIRSLPQILDVFPNTILVIVGRGVESEKLNQLTNDLGLSRHVLFLGFVNNDELSALYQLCSVFAMPHKELKDGDTEGFGIVFLEANAHGKPVIGGNAGGVRDAILDGVTGLIVDGREPYQIAEALIKLLGDRRLAEQMGEQGRQRVLNELTPEKGAERLLTFCHRIWEERLVTKVRSSSSS